MSHTVILIQHSHRKPAQKLYIVNLLREQQRAAAVGKIGLVKVMVINHQKIVARHDQAVVVHAGFIQYIGNIADCAALGCVVVRAVVVYDQAGIIFFFSPFDKMGIKFLVGYNVNLINFGKLIQLGNNVIEKRSAADRQQRLGEIFRQRIKPGRVTRSQYDRLHLDTSKVESFYCLLYHKDGKPNNLSRCALRNFII